MKKYLLIICTLVSMALCQDVLGQNAKWYDGLPCIEVTPDGITAPGEAKNVLCFEHDGEFYVYLDSMLVVSKKENYGIYRESENSCFFGRNDASVSTNTGFALSSERIIGAQDDTCSVVRFKVQDTRSHKFMNLRFRRSIQKSYGELIDTTGLGIKDDKLTRNVNDTINTLTVIEPKFSVYQSLELNGEKLHELDTIIGYNDPERSDIIEINFKPYWDKLNDGNNTITVKVASLDENYGFTEVYSKDYVIVVQTVDESKSFPWLWVILGGVLVLLVAFAVILGVNYSKKKTLFKRLSACKTLICNLQDDASVPFCAKDRLEVLSQRVTAAIGALHGKKLIKKADKEECGKLLSDIEEYVNKLRQPQPQPLSNEELLAKIKELEEKLSKAEEEKQSALAEQKTKLDERHEKAVNELREQLEQKHEKELQAQKDLYEKKLANLSDKHAKELEEQEYRYHQALEAQKNEYEGKLASQAVLYRKKLAEQEQRHKEELNALTEKYETNLRQTEEEHRREIAEIEEKCARAIANLAKELEEVRSKWQEDKKYVVNMYRAYETGIGDMVESMKSNGDDVAPAYAEMLQIHSESVHSFQSFHDQFQAIMERDLTIAQMREELAKVFSVHIDYERSWINALCRLHAYAKVEKLAPMFGLYNEYKVDISELYMHFLALASILGFEKIRVPELFVEEFESATAESDNANLVLPNIYPDYVTALVSSTIYDIHTIGYTFDGTTRKPKVAYYV